MTDTLVLCYHALSEDWPADLSARPGAFEEQIELMLSRGYRGSTFSDAVLSPQGGKTLVVTFDDAFRSVAELALPILERLGIPATIFAVSNFARRGEPLSWEGIEHWQDGPHAGELESLDWSELRDLQSRGWEVGSHTASHPHLTRLEPAELARELEESRSEVSAGTGRECRSIAYPYGALDSAVVEAAGAAGYRAGAALPARAHRSTELEWLRVGVYHGDDLARFKLKVSRAVRAARLLLRR
jgi:peptidoglycan/xylan/chitin deacetylase (PgdA/CDA1 family)